MGTLRSADSRNDRDIVLEALKQNGSSLQFADDLLKKDHGIVLEALEQNGSSLQFADGLSYAFAFAHAMALARAGMPATPLF